MYRNLTRETVFDISLKMRCSIGLRVGKYIGAFGEIGDTVLYLPKLHSDYTLAVLLEQESKLKIGQNAYIQFAILYSLANGQRKIRVFNYSFPITSDLSIFLILLLKDPVFLSMDMDSIINIEAKKSCLEIFQSNNKISREKLCQTAVNVLAYYRKKVPKIGNSSQFYLPEPLKLYPLLALSLMKSYALTYLNDIEIDKKVAFLSKYSCCSFTDLLFSIYPRNYSISQIISNENNWGYKIIEQNVAENPNNDEIFYKPQNIASSVEKMKNSDCYLIVNSEFFFIYIPKECNPIILQKIFSVSNFAELSTKISNNSLNFYEIDTQENRKLQNVLQCLRTEKGGSYQEIIFIPQGHIFEKYMIQTFLVEDSKNPAKDFSHIQFLCHLHKLILNKSLII